MVIMTLFFWIMIKAVKEYERISLEIVYLFVSVMLFLGLTVLTDERSAKNEEKTIHGMHDVSGV